ncbi:MAG: N-acetylmuramoyl-L-alanine amidase [Alphaproteobacteria bacterium]|nr:MAG: N-acetylmuramoyl-L-alanine amidase [Alphaproteobacteria bacterium]
MVRLAPHCWIFALAVLLWGAVGQGTGHAENLKISSIRVHNHGDYTRFVLDMSQPAKPSIFTLADPYRVVIDLPDVDWAEDANSGKEGEGLVAGYRFGHFRPGNSRIVIDMTRPGKIAKVFALPPGDGKGHRFVIDLETTSRDAFLASAGWPKDQKVVAAQPRTPIIEPRKKGKYVVVIDPGHGGVDPGATGRTGLIEKNVSLSVAKELRNKLEKTGRYDVVMTRDKDVFYSLDDRVEIARKAGADLFISLHADTIKDPQISGLSVYTLSEKASDKAAAELASKENRADVIAGVNIHKESSDVSMILIELSQRETMNRSVAFAETLMPQLKKETTLLRNTHRYAGFVVLKAPDVPSVLLELGFLSNKTDEKNLKSSRWQANVARGITSSVDQHFKNEELGGYYTSRQAFLK